MEADKELEVTPEEFRAWVDHPITKQIVKAIFAQREAVKEFVAQGNTIRKDSEVSTDFMVGQIRGLNELFNLFSDAKEEAKPKVDYDH